MKLIGDYHTHTTFSHGIGSIEDNLQVAINREMSFVGISDHGPAHMLHGLKRSDLPIMKEQVDRLNETYRSYGTKVLLGVEANVVSFDGTIDVWPSDRCYYDFLLLGYHYMTKMLTLKDVWKWYFRNTIDQWVVEKDSYRKLTTNALIKAIERYPITAITHPGAKVHIDFERLADACVKVGTALEVNEKNHHLNMEELLILKNHNVSLLLSSDAHRPEDVGHVIEAAGRIQNAGISLERVMNGK